MSKNKLIYDIRTCSNALDTLCNLTGVPAHIWGQYIGRECEYPIIDNMVEEIVNSYGYFPYSYREFDYIYFHITTSNNKCDAICKNGLMDLKNSYMCKESELRKFLGEHEIYIDLENRKLKHKEQEYDITYTAKRPRTNTEEYYRWSVGEKFYHDYATCGFLSIWKRSPYGGYVHHRPEILRNIDDLLGMKLSREWKDTHEAYEIVAKVKGEKIIYGGYDEQSEREKVLDYLTRAYMTVSGEPTEEILVMKNNVQIPAEHILEINKFNCWK